MSPHSELPWHHTLADSIADEDADATWIESPECSIAEMICPAEFEEANADLICRAVNHHDALIKALEALLANHVQLVTSGDCGNWNVEEEAEVIAARALLQAVQKGK